MSFRALLVEKDDEGKRKIKLKENTVSEPVYKKVKVKFHLDGISRVLNM